MQTDAPVVPAPPRAAEWSRIATWGRAALLVGWLTMLAVAVCFGVRQSSFASLQGAIAAGKVHQVDVATVMTAPVQNGSNRVELTWRRGLLRHTTAVLESSSGGSIASYKGNITAVVGPDVVSQLRNEGVGVRVGMLPTTTAGPVLGWTLSGWMAWPFLALVLGTVMFLIGAPEPWRATRWAWWWLISVVPPVGLIAYLLLSGPTPLIAAPRTTRRLTGGWALLLALAISGITATGLAAN